MKNSFLLLLLFIVLFEYLLSVSAMGNILTGESTTARDLGSQQQPGEYERRQADMHARLRGEAYVKSKTCYQSGDHAGAKKYSDMGKEHDRKMNEFNDKAANVIYGSKNSGRPDDSIDLHGLHVDEAKLRVERHIAVMKRKKIKKFEIIVGKGLHSKDGIARLKPAILQMCRRHSLRCTIDPRNEGCINAAFVSRKRSGFFGWLRRTWCRVFRCKDKDE
jgi:DNA-nicking Smr family endonuclease